MSQKSAYDRLATEVGILQEGWWPRKKERKGNEKINIRIKPHAQNKKQEQDSVVLCIYIIPPTRPSISQHNCWRGAAIQEPKKVM